jgi:hypothetical protein
MSKKDIVWARPLGIKEVTNITTHTLKMTPEEIAKFIATTTIDSPDYDFAERGIALTKAISIIEELLYDNTAEKIANRIAADSIQDIYESRIKELKANFEDVKTAHDKLVDTTNTYVTELNALRQMKQIMEESKKMLWDLVGEELDNDDDDNAMMYEEQAILLEKILAGKEPIKGYK